MFELLKKKREERTKLIADARALIENADKEKRAMSDEETAQYDEMFKRANELKDEITRIEGQVEEERQLADSELRRLESEGGAPGGDDPPAAPGDDNRAAHDTDEYRAAFGRFLSRGVGGMSIDERRNLQAGAGDEGGFLVAPMQFMDRMIQAIDDLVFIRGHATVDRMMAAQSMGFPSLDADPADADWTTELLTGSEDSTMKIGRREFTPNPMAKRIKISKTLLRLSPSAEALVIRRLAYKFAITQEKAYLTGTGAKQPLGIFTASAQGISTARDYATDNTTTAITADGLRGCKYSLKAGYRRGAHWMFHRDAVGNISKLKDGNGQYLWREGIAEGEPDRLLGMAVDESEYVPNTFTTGLYVGALADFSLYNIVDAMDMQIQRLDELYAETNEVGFIARYEGDGMPVLEEAFARVTLS